MFTAYNSKCSTVKILYPASASGYKVINAVDYDPNIHTLFVSKSSQPSTVGDAGSLASSSKSGSSKSSRASKSSKSPKSSKASKSSRSSKVSVSDGASSPARISESLDSAIITDNMNAIANSSTAITENADSTIESN